MQITKATWNKYSEKQKQIREKAANEMADYINRHGIDDPDDIVAFAFKLATKYGEAAASYACDMYDWIADAQKANVRAAEPAPTADYSEVAKAINGSLKQSVNGNLISSTLERLVKQAGEDTMIQNAARDKAETAWIPDGGACPYCLGIAAEGWTKVSASMIDSHAEHIHSSCSCEYSIRFDQVSNVENYEPEEIQREIDEADGRTEAEKINSMRREQYEDNADEINEQKRIMYKYNKINQKPE